MNKSMLNISNDFQCFFLPRVQLSIVAIKLVNLVLNANMIHVKVLSNVAVTFIVIKSHHSLYVVAMAKLILPNVACSNRVAKISYTS